MSGEVVYAVTSTGGLSALSVHDGSVMWRHELGKLGQPTCALAAAGNRLLVGHSVLSAFKPETAAGT